MKTDEKWIASSRDIAQTLFNLAQYDASVGRGTARSKRLFKNFSENWPKGYVDEVRACLKALRRDYDRQAVSRRKFQEKI